VVRVRGERGGAAAHAQPGRSGTGGTGGSDQPIVAIINGLSTVIPYTPPPIPKRQSRKRWGIYVRRYNRVQMVRREGDPAVQSGESCGHDHEVTTACSPSSNKSFLSLTVLSRILVSSGYPFAVAWRFPTTPTAHR